MMLLRQCVATLMISELSLPLTISTMPNDPHLLREGGFETRPYGTPYELSFAPSTSRTGVSGINPARRRASVSSPLCAHFPATARCA